MTLSLRDYQGNLHGHSKEGDESTPDSVVMERVGSNCGAHSVSDLVDYYLKEDEQTEKGGRTSLFEHVAVTEHSRDPSPKEALESVTAWFRGMCMSTITEEQVQNLAKELLYYKDERLKKSLKHMEDREECDDRVIRGVEVNVLPDGRFDTDMVAEGAFELVNASLHASVDPEGFEPILSDPEAYTDLIVKAIQNPQTNIMCHLEGDADLFQGWELEDLDWERIAQAAIDNQVAIEINLRKLMEYIYTEKPHRTDLEKKLPTLVPILNSENIRERLKPFFAQGLRIAINTDEHKNPFVEGTDTRGSRFWRAMKMLENYLNAIFTKLGVDASHIINTYSREDLRAFLMKQKP